MVVGMTQMRKKRVVVRQLSALEALGGVTNICSDKTGTLTQGHMVTRKAWIPGVGIYSLTKSNDANNPTRGTISVSQPPASKQEAEQERERKRAEQDQLRSAAGLTFDVPAEKEERDQRRMDELRNEKELNGDEEKSEDDDDDEAASLPEVVPELSAFLESSALCNLATVRYDEDKGKWQTMGDPTEIALQVFSHRFGYGKKSLESEKGWKELSEYPFDSSVKRMSVIYERPNIPGTIIFTKGAVERVLELCTSFGIGEHQTRMTPESKEQILEQMNMLAEQGLRVLAIAQKTGPDTFDKHDELPREKVESDLTLLGLAGLYDPPRLETKDAVKGEIFLFPFFLFPNHYR